MKQTRCSICDGENEHGNLSTPHPCARHSLEMHAVAHPTSAQCGRFGVDVPSKDKRHSPTHVVALGPMRYTTPPILPPAQCAP